LDSYQTAKKISEQAKFEETKIEIHTKDGLVFTVDGEVFSIETLKLKCHNTASSRLVPFRKELNALNKYSTCDIHYRIDGVTYVISPQLKQMDVEVKNDKWEFSVKNGNVLVFYDKNEMQDFDVFNILLDKEGFFWTVEFICFKPLGFK
jgi:hypothetical protein